MSRSAPTPGPSSSSTAAPAPTAWGKTSWLVAATTPSKVISSSATPTGTTSKVCILAPLFQPNGSWHIYGPRLAGSLGETLAGQMQYSYFPVSIEQLAATAEYHDLVEGSFTIGDIQ